MIDGIKKPQQLQQKKNIPQKDRGERILRFKTRHGIEEVPESIAARCDIHNYKENKFLGDTKGNKTPPKNEYFYDGQARKRNLTTDPRIKNFRR